MPLDVPVRSYVLAATEGGDAVRESLAGLPGGLRIEAREPQERTTTLLDTADRRLRAAGVELEADTTGPIRLELRDGSSSRPATAELPKALRRYLVTDLPSGPVRTKLARILDVRALLPLAEVRRTDTPLVVLNRDDKTVVRLTLSDIRVGDDEPLASRLTVVGVLGYQRPFGQVRRLLEKDAGLGAPEISLIDEAIGAVGGDPEGVANDAKVSLDADDPAGQAARRILNHLAGIVEANIPGTLADDDTEFVHDLRVAIRRSRSILRELKRAFDDDLRREHAHTLRWIQRITGPTRDLDVQLLEWDDLSARLPEERRAPLAPARAVLRRRRSEALRALRRNLRSAQFQRRWSAWRDFLASTDPASEGPKAHSPLHKVASKRVHKVYDRMIRDGGAIDESSPSQALHDLRKKGKELRYLLESFGQLWPSSTTKPLVTQLKALQDVLGRHQDREVQVENLRSLATDLVHDEAGPDAVLALGSLVDRLEDDQHQAREEFAGRFAAFAKQKLSGIT